MNKNCRDDRTEHHTNFLETQNFPSVWSVWSTAQEEDSKQCPEWTILSNQVVGPESQ